MNISNLNSLTSSSYSVQENKGNLLTKAIKDYKDEFLTGLTDDDREKIKQEIREFIAKYPKDKKLDPAELNAFVAGLLRKYGYKGDIDAMAQTLIGDVETELKDESNSSSDAAIAYEKLSAGKDGNQLLSDPTDVTKLQEVPPEDQTVTHVITNPDGSKSLVVMKNKIIISTCKLTTEGDLIKCDNTSDAVAKATADLEHSVATA